MDVSDYIFYFALIAAAVAVIYKFLTVLYTSWILSSPTLEDHEIPFDSILTSNNENFIDNYLDYQTFKVFCASERSLSKFLNVFPWESRGFLSFDGHNIHFSGFKAKHRRLFDKTKKLKVRYKFPRNQVRISYVSSSFFRDGGLEWLKVEAHNRKFYFTSGHNNRLKIGRTGASTREIYELVSDF